MLGVECHAARGARDEAVGAAVFPVAAAVFCDEEAAVVGAEEDVLVVRRIDCERMPVLAVAVLQLPPGEPAPLRGAMVIWRRSLEHAVEVGPGID